MLVTINVGGYKCLLAGEWWHVGGYKCLLAGEWCMLVAINVYWLVSGGMLMFTGWRVVHVGGYKCLLAGEWCMLVDINVYCMVSGACWWL